MELVLDAFAVVKGIIGEDTGTALDDVYFVQETDGSIELEYSGMALHIHENTEGSVSLEYVELPDALKQDDLTTYRVVILTGDLRYSLLTARVQSWLGAVGVIN